MGSKDKDANPNIKDSSGASVQNKGGLVGVWKGGKGAGEVNMKSSTVYIHRSQER